MKSTAALVYSSAAECLVMMYQSAWQFMQYIAEAITFDSLIRLLPLFEVLFRYLQVGQAGQDDKSELSLAVDPSSIHQVCIIKPTFSLEPIISLLQLNIRKYSSSSSCMPAVSILKCNQTSGTIWKGYTTITEQCPSCFIRLVHRR